MVYALMKKKRYIKILTEAEKKRVRQTFEYLPPGMIGIIQSIPFTKACLMIESRTERLK